MLPSTSALTIPISIHAPSRERRFFKISISSNTNFNPRSLTGATAPERKSKTISSFQSTLPHGSDPVPDDRSSNPTYFNPRSLTGATPIFRYRIHCDLRFQSTLPHGSDFTFIILANVPSLFQSTLPHGSDYKIASNAFYLYNFNPRSLTGATHHA